jgi:hypothetical protein
MQQITNIQDLRTAVNENGQRVITLNSEDDIIMKMDEYRKNDERGH